ncbi:MAG: ABC transporter substrate-binding protein [Rhodobacteraceae bacterium]|nr:ABC transporter substrate-binding protein [Paracoccaceae bacterium]
MLFRREALAIVSGTLVAFGATVMPVASTAQTTLRVAMTAADIPDYTGAPDQGYEGYRFLGYTLYDTLALWDLSSSDKPSDIYPGLATGWKIDPEDNTKWTFTLREGVKFHDGCDWNADAFMWNVARVKDETSPQYNARHAGMQRSGVVNVESVEKVDDYTVTIHTPGPASMLPYELSVFFQISPCKVESVGYDYEKYREDPSGTGPYKFESVVPHERITLAKNENYWNPDRIPQQDFVELIPMPEASPRAAALLSGQVDFIEAPSPDTIPRLKGSGMQIVTVPYPHNWDYMLNESMPPFDNKLVRQAANYAVNRDEIVEMLQGVAAPAYQSLIESQPWYGDPVVYNYDPDKAKSLLDEAGCDPCKIKVGISTSGSGQMQPLPMNELVKEQMEASGFEVELVPMDWNALIGVFYGGGADSEFNAINFSMAPLDPVQGIMKRWMTKYQSPNCCNWGMHSNAEIDALGEEALATFDVEKQNELFTRMNEISVEEAQELYIVHDLNPRALAPYVKGFVQAQNWFQDLTPITIEK